MEKKSNTITKKSNSKKITTSFIIFSCIFLSLFMIYGWISESKKILTLLTGEATMKFNTALVLLFSGINLFIIDKKDKTTTTLLKTLSVINVFIGAVTLITYAGFSFIYLDNLFISDTLSKTNPGKMSPATAICSILLNISFLGYKSSNNLLVKLSRKSKLLVTIISFAAIISYVLIIPSENKTLLFKTMAIPTAILFFLMASILMFKRKNSIFNSLFFDKNVGSEIFRNTLPLIILIPIVLANALLSGIHKNWVSVDFGIATFTIILTPIGVWYLSKIAIKMKFIENKNKELITLDKALNTANIFSILDTKGIMLFANDSFSESYKLDKEEIINNPHPILNNQISDKVLVDKIWSTLNSGNTWTGTFKNKTKEGQTYIVNTTFTPLKDTTGKIKTILEINGKSNY